MPNELEHKPRILLVEDDPDGRAAVTDALRDGNCEVVAADCGRKGVEIFRSRAFDAVLSDIKLPDIDGIEVLRQILQKERKMIRRDENSYDKSFKLMPKDMAKKIVGHSPDFFESWFYIMIFSLYKRKNNKIKGLWML